ncbi:MAG: hypothetical protein A2147_07170 [Chloroflexi bacterium RBG_16_57_8]|nr:MAG: hypothetical protein A2147_07170 [Chloroflexi bacterium RBG_16_57_8]
MVALCLISSAERSGKTTIAAAIGRHLIGQGRRVGFFKPSLTAGPDPDAGLMREALGLDETLELLSPAYADEKALKDNVKSAFARISAGKDVVIIEGPAGRSQLTDDIAEQLDARAVAIEAYSRQLTGSVESTRKVGGRLIGVVLNKVPRSRLAQAKAELAQAGIKVLGVIPEDRALLTLTVAELARGTGGSIVQPKDGNTAALMENIMLGAMSPDHGPEYYSHKTNKAVVIRSDRPDMQLAALDTSTKCLVLAGKAAPIPMVLRRAEQRGVPVISADNDVAGVVVAIEAALQDARLNKEKVARAAVLVAQHLDFGVVYNGLGLSGQR